MKLAAFFSVFVALVVISEAQYYGGGYGGRGRGRGRGGNNPFNTLIQGFFLGKGLALGAATGQAIGNALFRGKRSVEADELSSRDSRYSGLLEEGLESLDFAMKGLSGDTCVQKTVCNIMTEPVDDTSLFSQALHRIYATPGYIESLMNLPGHADADTLWRAGLIGDDFKNERACSMAYPECSIDSEIIKQRLDYDLDQICGLKPDICAWRM